MLLQLSHHTNPFSFFHVTSAFSVEQCTVLEKLFTQAGEWQHRDGAFYRCSLRDVTEFIPEEFKTDVTARMREITGLPLVERMVVTAQRMLPGQVIGIHSDRPLLGYESVRLVLQLNKHWQPEHGGILELFTSPESDVVRSVNPLYNEAFGFLLNAGSYHGVTEATQPRQTVVFNFWHSGNTPELEAHVQTLFTNINFSELPAALNPVATAAEASLAEDITFRAGTAAVALVRWGYDDATVVAGYQHSAGVLTCDVKNVETYVAVLLADWVARLYRDSFDLARWEILRSELEGVEKFSRLMLTWQLCIPG